LLVDSHLISGTRQRLIEDGADRRIVVGNQYASRRHFSPSQVPPPGSASVTREFGHQHAKDRPSRLRFTFDDPAVIADDLRDQCKTEAAFR